MPFDRAIFFDYVRQDPFGGSLNQEQVDGMEYILGVWEKYAPGADLRWLAYPLATTKHETASTMQPIEEYGKGQGMSYGKADPVTGQTYYGRGFVQLTWADNYKRADNECGFTGKDSCYWYAENALDPVKAARIMFLGMHEGWFRSDGDGPQTLGRYFNEEKNDAFTAREIINGDKNYVPDWATDTIGSIISDYHKAFLTALNASYYDAPVPAPSPVADKGWVRSGKAWTRTDNQAEARGFRPGPEERGLSIGCAGYYAKPYSRYDVKITIKRSSPGVVVEVNIEDEEQTNDMD